MQSTLSPAEAPYRNPSANRIYEMLFCDRPELFAANNETKNNYPWNVLLSSDDDVAALQEVTEDKSLETRLRLLAHNKLKQAGYTTNQKELLGVVIEVALPNGLDVLAAYEDGTARYLNASGKMIIWDTATAASDSLIGDLFAQSRNLVQYIGPWQGQRRAHPAEGMARLNFLVSDGLYFGEGEQEALFGDALAKPVVIAAIALMQYLTETALASEAQ